MLQVNRLRKHKFVRPVPIKSGVIAIDVDGTLLLPDGLNERLVAWCRYQKEQGKTLLLWSARGEAYARKIAERLDVSELFDLIIGKPETIVDDKGWSWIRYSRVERELSIESESESDNLGPS